MKLHRGFTIIELMIAVLVLALLATVGVPSFGNIITNNRIVAQANSLHADILYARSEAVKRDTKVVICWSGNPAATTPCGASGTGWGDGWIVFVDSDEDDTFDAGEPIVKAQDGLTAGVSLSLSGPTQIVYEGDGRLGTAGSPTFKFCSADNDNQYTREIDISPLGNPKVAKKGICP